MHVKTKYIDAVHLAIDFIENAVDGADEDKQEQETLSVLRELREQMKASQHKGRVNYYLNKIRKNKKHD